MSTSDSWVAFEHALARAVSDLDEDEFLVIERKNTNYFVQFAAQGSSGLRVEASANAYQPRPARIPMSSHPSSLRISDSLFRLQDRHPHLD